MRDQRIRRQKRRGGVFRRRPFLEIDRLRQAIAARALARERRQMRAATERVAPIARQRADIHAAAAFDLRRRAVVRRRQQPQRIDFDRADFGRRAFSGARVFVKFFAAIFERGIIRRALLDCAGVARQQRLDFAAQIRRRRGAAQDLAFRVVGCGLDAKANDGAIGLFAGKRESQKPCRAPDGDDQQAVRQRIERAAVSRPRRSERFLTRATIRAEETPRGLLSGKTPSVNPFDREGARLPPVRAKRASGRRRDLANQK